MTETGPTENLAGRVAAGAIWIVGARFVMRAFGFVNTIVLARLLAPEDFGVVAVATAAMQLLQGVSDFGVSQAVIKFRETGRVALDSLFTLSAARGVLIAAILCAIAPLAADFYSDPRIFWVFTGIALYPLLTGFANPAFYEFERDLELSKEFISSALTKLAGVVVSVAIALAFRSYWAIILGLAASGAVQLVLSYAMRPYAPRFSLAGARSVLGFSGWLFGVSIITALNNKLDTFVVARALGPAETGLYTVGCQFAELPTSELAAPIARAIYPGLSALQGDVQRMTAAFLRGVEALAVIALPACFGLSFVARDLVPLLLGAQWAEAVPVVQLTAPMLGFQSMFLATYYYGLALGKARLVFFREVAYFVLRFPIFVYAVLAHGLQGAIYAAASLGFFRVALNLVVYAQASGRPFWEPLYQARRSFAATAAMVVWFVFLRPQIALVEAAPPIARLAADIFMGAAVYGAAHFALWRVAGSPSGAESALLQQIRKAMRPPAGV